MPTSTFGSFETAKSGLSVAMQQLNVTEQNISNVNTAGYTRQRILTSAKEPASSTYLIAQLSNALVGQGVETTGIQQIRSEYLDKQYRTLNTNYNYSAARSSSLEYMTGLFNELNDDGTLSSSIESFFSALNTFSSDTSSKEFRTNVQQQALGMTESFNNVYEEMQSLWQDQNDSIATMAEKINSVAQKIAQLNDSIASVEQTGGTANDLCDERNLLLDELSGYVNYTYTLNPDNNSMLDISIGGIPLVEGKTTNTITVSSLSDNAAEIDAITTQIAAINDDIANGVVTSADGKAAIDLLVNGPLATGVPLSDYLTVTTSDNAANTDLVDVKFGDVSLVKGITATSVADAVETDITAWVSFNSNNLTLGDPALGGGALTFGGTVTGGQLYSHMEMVTSQSALSPGIPYYMEELNTFVRDMAKSLNDISQTGYTYPDGTTASTTGVNFFNVPNTGTAAVPIYDYSQVNAGNFTLSDEVIASAYNIAGSSSQVVLGATSTESGNNEIALKLFQNLADSEYYDKLNSIVGNLAIAANTSDSIMSTKESLMESIETQRLSVSAVSLDEETTNLIIFQQSYQACARIITTLDEMLNTLINTMAV